MVDKDISQTKLGQLTGISRYTIIKYCAGKSVPKVDNLLKIAVAMGKELTYFFE